ncbi:MAG: GNAT family N-acetyltransferase [Chloroflexi bacterium]|nr:GNAT family N-acetyltransferase [Chloroflexota bacterium]
MIRFEQTTLETPRLTIRWLRADDVDALFQIFSDEQAMRYWSSLPMQTVQDAQLLLKSAEDGYANNSGIRFGLELKETDQLLGTCSLFNFHHTSRRAEIGYILGRPYWGNGFMHEALVAIVDYAFNQLDLHRLEADIDPRNNASRQSLLRLGFLKEGLLRERWIVNGEVSDSELYGLLRSEWKGETAVSP